MGRAPCCDKANVKKGPWSPEEDSKLKNYIEKYGTGGNWIALPQKVGLKRCGKSCRLRWLNYLRPNIKHGEFTEEEDRIICTLFANIGSRWSIIAAQLPGRTDNDIKNYWNTKLKKKLLGIMVPPPLITTQTQTHESHTKHHLPQQQPLLQNLPLLVPSFNNYYNHSTDHHLVHDQIQEQVSFVHNNNPMQHSTNHLLIFGSDQTSCSSSENGSCNNQYSSSNIKQEDHQMGFVQSFISNSGFHENHSNNNKLSISSSSTTMSSLGFNNDDVHEKGYFGEVAFDYDIEDLKQLIRSSTNYDGV